MDPRKLSRHSRPEASLVIPRHVQLYVRTIGQVNRYDGGSIQGKAERRVSLGFLLSLL